MLGRLLALGAFFAIGTAAAQEVDTVQRLDEITISSQRTPSTLRTATPTQVLESEAMEHIGALQLSDAVKLMAGVTLKDYGGVGGVKTVSARGLGSQFSAVTIDGVPVDDSQNGQVDLGRYTLGNTAYVSFSQGQDQAPLLSARAYAAGNVLNMETAQPRFFPGERVRMKAGLEGGSFGLLSPTLQWEQRWSKRLTTSLWANYLQSAGDYPFTVYYTASRQDSSSTERRNHSAVWMATADANLFYTIGQGNSLSAKLHYMRGSHELPGPVHYYSQSPSGQSSDEELAFAQARWRIERDRWKGQLMAKLRHSFDTFLDTTPGTHADNDYRQREGYLSATYNRELARWLVLDLAADGSVSHLVSTQQNLGAATRTTLTDVQRTNLMAVAALLARADIGSTKAEVRGHLLYTDVQDRADGIGTRPAYRRLTPYLSLMLTPHPGTTLRAFYKDSYRAPNFGELYFFQLFPPNLKPEHARQLNLGITHAQDIAALQLSATLDAYYNRVTNKIVSYPKQSMYYWSTENLGTVDILGADATANLSFSLQQSTCYIQLNYTYQHAADHSDKGSKVYGHQIVYTPRHSGGLSARWEGRWVNLGATAMMVGERYYMQQNTPDYRLPAYCDLGLSADRKFDLRLGTLGIRAQLLNLLGAQYEVINAYPMMGRNWRLAVTYEF